MIKKKDKDGNYLMTFELDELSQKEIVCYTKEKNDFKLYNKYALYIKENSQIVKSIEKYNRSTDRNYKLSTFTKYLNDPNTETYIALVPVIIIFMAIGGIVTLFVALFTRNIPFGYILLIDIVTIFAFFILYVLLSNMKKSDLITF